MNRSRFGQPTEPGSPAAGSSLRGPARTGKTVILLHGFAEASSALEARRAAALNRHGWNVAVLDSRGYGMSDGPLFDIRRSRGRPISKPGFGSSRIVTRRAYRPCPFVPCCGVAQWEPGLPCATAVAEPTLAALVLESPMVDLDISMSLVFRRRMIPFPRLMARLVTRRAGKLAGVPIHTPRPIDSARQVTCPTLILHGTNDTIVSIDEARRLAGALPAPPHWIEDSRRASHRRRRQGGRRAARSDRRVSWRSGEQQSGDSIRIEINSFLTIISMITL